MGQSSTSPNRLHNQWNFVDTLSGIEIYKNQNNQLAEKHVVRIDPKIDENDYITAYYQRYLPNKPIVNVFDAQFLQRSVSMCQNSAVLTVFTEYIPFRLSNVKMLDHGQGVYVLSEALAGFAELFGRVGPFQIHEDLIGFNQEGQVRVWYNPNFADNAVDNDRIILMSTINPYGFDEKFSQNQEYDMVEDTINVVARYTQFSPKFLQQVQELKKISFNEASIILSNEIARKAYYVPDHLFLGDNNGILLKSGVELKRKHIVNPNKPKKGTKYPYFMDSPNQPQHHNNYHPHVDYGSDSSSSQQNYYHHEGDSSSQSSDYHQGGYYNLNGENFRIIGTKQIEGNEINQQAIIDEIVRRNNSGQGQVGMGVEHSGRYTFQQQQQQQQQQQVYANPPIYQVEKPTRQYREGHIVFRDSPQFINTSDTRFSQVQSYHTIPNQANLQSRAQQNVKVFSVGPNGRLVEERQLSQAYSNQSPVYQSRNAPLQTRTQSQQQQWSSAGLGNRTNVAPLDLVQNVPKQGSPSLSHRHKIFGPPSPKRMVMVPETM